MQFDEDILELEEREEREAFSVRNSKTVCYWNANFNKVSFRLLLVRAFKMFISCIQTYMHTYITFMYPQIYRVALKLALCLLAAVRTQTMFTCKG